MSDIANGAAIVALVLWLYGFLADQAWARLWGSAIIALAYVVAFAADAAAGDGWGALLDGVFGAVWAWLWWSEWRKRKRRDPAARQFGARSRLLVAALVTRAREAAQPRRVLRPVPGGAHAG